MKIYLFFHFSVVSFVLQFSFLSFPMASWHYLISLTKWSLSWKRNHLLAWGVLTQVQSSRFSKKPLYYWPFRQWPTCTCQSLTRSLVWVGVGTRFPHLEKGEVRKVELHSALWYPDCLVLRKVNRSLFSSTCTRSIIIHFYDSSTIFHKHNGIDPDI